MKKKIFLFLIIMMCLFTTKVFAANGSASDPYIIEVGEIRTILIGDTDEEDTTYTIFTTNEHKVLSFFLSEPASYSKIYGHIGYVLDVYDDYGNHYYSSSGQQDENKSISSNGTITFSFVLSLDAGTYHYDIKPTYGSVATTIHDITFFNYSIVEINASLKDAFEVEYNNTKETANALEINKNYSGYMHPINGQGTITDEDYYYVDLTAGVQTEVYVTMGGFIKNPTVEPLVYLHSPNKSTTDVVYNYGNSSSNMTCRTEDGLHQCAYSFVPQVSGRYYLEVTNGLSAQVLYVIGVQIVKPLNDISFVETSGKMRVGDTKELVVNFDPVDTTDNKTITWSSSDSTVVEVNNGVLTAKKDGNAIIYATVMDKTIQYEVDVDDVVPVYRMYNPVNGEHLYTTDAYEVSVIYSQQGWGFEGIGWYSLTEGTPVYRLYNPVLGNHLYTSDEYEISIITTSQGWVLDFDGAPVMYSSGDVPIYRLFNPGLQGQHHLTTDENEYNVIPMWGWQQEGIGLNAIEAGVPITTYYYKDSKIDIDFKTIENNNLATANRYASVIKDAKYYIRISDYSLEGLVERLERAGYTHEDALYGAEHSGADWNKEALDDAKSWLRTLDVSYERLIERLELDKFTHEQAVYAVENCGGDWYREALDDAKSWLRTLDISYGRLIERLETDKFTHEQAVYAVENCGGDWYQEAVDAAKSYMSYSSYTYDKLVSRLEGLKFTHEQAVYGADNCGYF